jgi:hypothetical protein
LIDHYVVVDGLIKRAQIALSNVNGPSIGRDRIYAVRRFIAVYQDEPGRKRVEAVHGDESPDGINAVPTLVERVLGEKTGRIWPTEQLHLGLSRYKDGCPFVNRNSVHMLCLPLVIE